MNAPQLNSIDEIDINLEKAYAILESYRSNVFIDSRELGENELLMLRGTHDTNSLLFCAAIDYLATAMNGLEQLLNNN